MLKNMVTNEPPNFRHLGRFSQTTAHAYNSVPSGMDYFPTVKVHFQQAPQFCCPTSQFKFSTKINEVERVQLTDVFRVLPIPHI